MTSPHPVRLAAALVLLAGLVACGTPEPEVPDPPAAPAPPAPPEEPAAPDPPDPPEEPAPEEPPPAPPPLAPPMRGTWVHLFDDTLKTRAGIASVVDDLVRAGATDVVAQVARRHDAYYASDVLPPTPDPALEPGLDVVAELTRRAHAEGIRVHAWVSIAPTWHQVYEDLPAPPGWVATEHGRDAPDDQRWVSRTDDGTWSDFLDPALPAVQEHVVAIAVELAERYPVDGIHLDYARYASERHGYHPQALVRFQEETGISGLPAPTDPDWSAWRRARTRELVTRVREGLDATGRDVALSAATIAWGPGPGHPDAPRFEDTRTYTEALQDWPGWARDGLVDAVMPMTYFRAHEPDQAAWFAAWVGFHRDLAAEVPALVVPGIGGWLNAPSATVTQVGRAGRGTDGVLVYSYQQPADDPEHDLWGELAATGWAGTADEG